MVEYLWPKTSQDVLELEEIQRENGVKTTVAYYCKVCGSFTWAYTDSPRRLAQRCRKCFKALRLKIAVNPELHDFIGSDSWRYMWEEIQEKISEISDIVDNHILTAARIKYPKLQRRSKTDA